MKKTIEENRWVMLPTEDKYNSAIMLGVTADNWRFTKDEDVINDTADWMTFGKPQHLYLTSDDEIKEGDWVVNISMNFIYKTKGKDLGQANDTVWNKKIIATTDKSLERSVTGYTESRSRTFYEKLPQIPEFFTKYYIEKRGKVGDVICEYNKDAGRTPFVGLNLTDNNEIMLAVTPVTKDMYSAEEVRQLMFDTYLKNLSNPHHAGTWIDNKLKK